MLHSAYSHEVCRKWMVNLPTKDQIVYPFFVLDQESAYQEIKSMPGVARYGYKNIVEHLEPLVNKYGLQSVLIFGILSDESQKDGKGTYAGTLDEKLIGPVHLAIKEIKKAFPKLMIIADVCLCAYTDHGHCAVLNENNQLDNQKSIERLGEVAVSYARAGADMVAPSDMMDNRVLQIKNSLKQHNLSHIPVMSYSAKFASAYYGPFRDVCKSTPLNFDRQSYQLPVDSTELALSAVERDIKEGTDFIIVKPLGNYLDIAAKIKQKFPQSILAGYNVSGEYSMVCFAAQNNACDLKKIVMEQLRCYKRSGIDIVITYFAPQILEWMSENK